MPSLRQPRILVLPMADELHGSSRLRAWQYIPYFERAGMEVRAVNRLKLSSDLAYGAAVLRGALWADLIFLQKRFLPGPLLRACRALGRKVVYDFDDAIYALRDGTPAPRMKDLHACLRLSAAVVAGNECLASYARAHNARVEVIPTPVAALPFTPKPRTPGCFVVGWIGSRGALPDLQLMYGVLQRLSKQIPEVVLKVISAEPVSIEGVRVENVRWQLATADEELRQADIGIMPVPDNVYGQGKCAYKALQCMSLGLPVVLSPVGMNREIVTNGIEGFLANSDDEWFDAVGRLHKDLELAAKMARAAYARAQTYTLERCAEKLLALCREVLENRR